MTLCNSVSLASLRALTSRVRSSSVGGRQSRNFGLNLRNSALEDSFSIAVFAFLAFIMGYLISRKSPAMAYRYSNWGNDESGRHRSATMRIDHLDRSA